MNNKALILECTDCRGSGRWFDMPLERRRVDFGQMGPSNCTSCDGWGITPTEEGRPFFKMVVAMRKSPKWR